MSKFSRSGSSTSLSANILCAVGIIAIAIVCGVLYLGYNPTAADVPPVEPIVYSTPASSYIEQEGDDTEPNDAQQALETEESPEPDDIPRDEWYMRLVNFSNLLEEDFAVDVVDVGGDFYFDARAAGDLTALLAAAEDAGMPLHLASGSRSWENQQARYEDRIDELMDEGLSEEDAIAQATQENELPVASEHILSLGVDIVPESNGDMDETILDEPAYQWLCEHAHEYGFIQRYPLGKGDVTGIQFEPWHFRFVGVEQATLIYESGLTLEEYLA